VGGNGVGRSHHCRIQKGREGADIIQTLRTEFFRRWFYRGLTPPLDIAAPPVATVLLAPGVVLPPLGSIKIEIETEIVYNMYRVSRMLSLGPPNNAIQETYKSGLDRYPPKSNLSSDAW
jgi:hypothetical protein